MTAIGAFQALVEFRYILLEAKMIPSRSLKIVANGGSWRRNIPGSSNSSSSEYTGLGQTLQCSRVLQELAPGVLTITPCGRYYCCLLLTEEETEAQSNLPRLHT